MTCSPDWPGKRASASARERTAGRSDGSDGDESVENEAVNDIISNAVVEEVFRRRVKGGDVVKVPIGTEGDNDGDAVRGWHIIRIDDLHLKPIDAASAFFLGIVLQKCRQ